MDNRIFSKFKRLFYYLAKDKRGVIIIPLIAILIMSGIISAKLVSETSTSISANTIESFATRAFYLAEGGFNYLAAKMSKGGDPDTVLSSIETGSLSSNNTYAFAGGTFTINMETYRFKVIEAANNSKELKTAVPFGLPAAKFANAKNGKIEISSSGKSIDYSSLSISGKNVTFTLPTAVSINKDEYITPFVSNVPINVTKNGNITLPAGTPTDLLPAIKGAFRLKRTGEKFFYKQLDTSSNPAILRGVFPVQGQTWTAINTTDDLEMISGIKFTIAGNIGGINHYNFFETFIQEDTSGINPGAKAWSGNPTKGAFNDMTGYNNYKGTIQQSNQSGNNAANIATLTSAGTEYGLPTGFLGIANPLINRFRIGNDDLCDNFLKKQWDGYTKYDPSYPYMSYDVQTKIKVVPPIGINCPDYDAKKQECVNTATSLSNGICNALCWWDFFGWFKCESTCNGVVGGALGGVCSYIYNPIIDVIKPICDYFEDFHLYHMLGVSTHSGACTQGGDCGQDYNYGVSFQRQSSLSYLKGVSVSVGLTPECDNLFKKGKIDYFDDCFFKSTFFKVDISLDWGQVEGIPDQFVPETRKSYLTLWEKTGTKADGKQNWVAGKFYDHELIDKTFYNKKLPKDWSNLTVRNLEVPSLEWTGAGDPPLKNQDRFIIKDGAKSAYVKVIAPPLLVDGTNNWVFLISPLPFNKGTGTPVFTDGQVVTINGTDMTLRIKDNFMTAFVGTNDCPKDCSGNENATDDIRKNYQRDSIKWPAFNIKDGWESTSDLFTVIKWDNLNPKLTDATKPTYQSRLAFMGPVDPANKTKYAKTIVRTNSMRTSNTTAFYCPEIALEGFGFWFSGKIPIIDTSITIPIVNIKIPIKLEIPMVDFAKGGYYYDDFAVQVYEILKEQAPHYSLAAPIVHQ
ncbi:MAG: hypothetical protein HQK79_18435 [Desulfobacterales bacterium]|nr:hypothetical protein [Desulfobacterales bacterium]